MNRWDSLKVHWPLGAVETWYDLSTDAPLELTEGSVTCLNNCLGCTYEAACNFSFDADIDDGSCDFTCLIGGLGVRNWSHLESGFRAL